MALRIQGGTFAAGTSLSIPTHRPGDLILLFAYRSTSNLAITVPSASATVPTWTTGGTSNANATYSVFAYAFATISAHTSGTWTNANIIQVVVIRNVASIGPVVRNTGSSSTINYAALTPQNTNGTSVIGAFAAANTGSTTSGIDTPPSGMVIFAGSNTSPRQVFHYSGVVRGFPRGLTTFSSANVNNTFISAWTTWVFEMKPKRASMIS